MKKEITELKQCEFSEGFYIVPGNERFSVNRAGRVFDRLNKEIAINSTRTENASGAKTYLSVYDFAVHRMVAETFLSKEHLPKENVYVVNHLDGNILNNDVDNLEWTTYRGNSIHAFQTGLRFDNIPLLCKDIETNIIIRYYSYQECARALGTNGANIFIYLNSQKSNKIIKNHFVIIKEGETWPEIELDFANYFSSDRGQDVFMRNQKTEKAFIFSNRSVCCRFLNISPAYLSKKFKSLDGTTVKEIKIEDWVIMDLIHAKKWFDKETTKAITVEGKIKTPRIVTVRRKPNKISVKNLESQEIKAYDSLEIFSNILGEKKNTVQKHILLNNGIWRGLFEIKYL